MIQKITQLECPICFNEELSSPQLVYMSCCFQKVCEVCDQIIKRCAFCETELGEIRIRFGNHFFELQKSSILRLLPGNHTVKSVIRIVNKFFPLIETQLKNPPIIKLLDSNGYWCYYYEGEISNTDQYYLQYMRLPHCNLTNPEVDKWILALLKSKNTLTKNPLTKEEFHRKCNSYSARICLSFLSQNYINSRLQSLETRKYCAFDKKTQTYYSIP